MLLLKLKKKTKGYSLEKKILTISRSLGNRLIRQIVHQREQSHFPGAWQSANITSRKHGTRS